MKFSKGFTLIEMIIVMSLFLLITGASLGIFISIIKSQKSILVEQQLSNQVSYIEEYMSKALRMARTDTTGDCLPENYMFLLTNYDSDSGFFKGIRFVDSEGICIEYLWEGNALVEIKNGAPTGTPLTSENDFTINSIKFSLNGSDSDINSISDSGGCTGSNPTDQCGLWYEDDRQPRITILLNVKVGSESAKIIQTTVSQRNLNIDNGQRQE